MKQTHSHWCFRSRSHFHLYCCLYCRFLLFAFQDKKGLRHNPLPGSNKYRVKPLLFLPLHRTAPNYRNLPPDSPKRSPRHGFLLCPLLAPTASQDLHAVFCRLYFAQAANPNLHALHCLQWVCSHLQQAHLRCSQRERSHLPQAHLRCSQRERSHLPPACLCCLPQGRFRLQQVCLCCLPQGRFRLQQVCLCCLQRERFHLQGPQFPFPAFASFHC